MAMAKLRELDQIAYIRFASVYESYEGLEDLRKEVDSLLAERDSEPAAGTTGGGSAGGKRFPKR
jgi:transcriptional regulator NrdR family protein